MTNIVQQFILIQLKSSLFVVNGDSPALPQRPPPVSGGSLGTSIRRIRAIRINRSHRDTRGVSKKTLTRSHLSRWNRFSNVRIVRSFTTCQRLDVPRSAALQRENARRLVQRMFRGRYNRSRVILFRNLKYPSVQLQLALRSVFRLGGQQLVHLDRSWNNIFSDGLLRRSFFLLLNHRDFFVQWRRFVDFWHDSSGNSVRIDVFRSFDGFVRVFIGISRIRIVDRRRGAKNKWSLTPRSWRKAVYRIVRIEDGRWFLAFSSGWYFWSVFWRVASIW